jgi:hypothetical protein
MEANFTDQRALGLRTSFIATFVILRAHDARGSGSLRCAALSAARRRRVDVDPIRSRTAAARFRTGVSALTTRDAAGEPASLPKHGPMRFFEPLTGAREGERAWRHIIGTHRGLVRNKIARYLALGRCNDRASLPSGPRSGFPC